MKKATTFFSLWNCESLFEIALLTNLIGNIFRSKWIKTNYRKKISFKTCNHVSNKKMLNNKVCKIICYTYSQLKSPKMKLIFFRFFSSQVCTQCGLWPRWPTPSRLSWARKSKDMSKTDTTWTSLILTNGYEKLF